MSGFILHPAALADIQDIADYIAADNPRAAANLIDEFHDRFLSLLRSPLQGNQRPNLTSRPLRFVVVRQYLIAYLANAQSLVIIGVIHGRRNPDVIRMMLAERQ